VTTRLRSKLATCHEQVVDAYNNGATLRQIAEVHEVSPGTVRNLLKELDVPLRDRGRRKNAPKADPRILPVAAAPDEPVASTEQYEGDFS
jgi:hypothetical protein